VKNLNRKVVAITGAASGIGKELANKFAGQGAILALNDWDENALTATVLELKQSGANVFGFPFDVSDRTSWELFADKIVEQFGHIDILINNAGITHYMTPVDKIDQEEFSRVLNVNMWGCIHGTQVMSPILKNRPAASLVNVSSSLGLVGYPYQGAYVMSKFAINGLTETLQLENRGFRNFHIMSVHPGSTRTNLVRNIIHPQRTQLDKMIHTFDKYSLSTATHAADKIIKGIRKKKKRVLIGKDTHYMVLISRLFPKLYHHLLPPTFNPQKLNSQKEKELSNSVIGKVAKT